MKDFVVVARKMLSWRILRMRHALGWNSESECILLCLKVVICYTQFFFPFISPRAPTMLGPRTRSASKRASSAEHVQGQDDERDPKRIKNSAREPLSAEALAASTFRITVITMAGAAISIDDASAADTIMSVKERVFSINNKLRVRRQRLVYTAGPHGMNPLADDETLGGAGVAQDGSAELDVLLVDLTEAEMNELGSELLEAAGDGCAADMLELLDEGADIEFQDENENTALILAAEGGQIECVRLLIARGADKDAKDTSGYTALVWVAQKGHADCARLLLENGADKNPKDNDGFTALIWAAQEGHTECVRLLVESGADKDATSNGGCTALILAAEKGHPDCVRLLLESGANKDAKDEEGNTALICAARQSP
jgi:ankyrin repeat protein